MKYLIYLGLLCTMPTQAQPNTGIQFEQQINWKSIREKAQQEYKYIFVECIKSKDQRRVTESNQSETVGNFYNPRFISVQFIIDSSTFLQQQLAGALSHTLPITTSTPNTVYLYFSPEGKLVHEGMGIKRDDELIQLGKQAMSSASQYFSMLDRYRASIREYSLMPSLALTARGLGNNALADSVALDYKGFMQQLPLTEMAQKNHLEFMGKFSYLIHSSDPLFQLYSKHPALADKETYEGYSQNMLERIIRQEEITPYVPDTALKSSYSPDWKKIHSSIAQKYGSQVAGKLVNEASINYFHKTNNWEAYSNAINEFLQKNPPKPGSGLSSDSWLLNGYAWDAFEHCDNKKALESALVWSSKSIELELGNVQYIDTKANLLYKLGKVEEAIATEKLAIETDNANAKRKGNATGYYMDMFTETIRKMKAGIPTWK